MVVILTLSFPKGKKPAFPERSEETHIVVACAFGLYSNATP
jgi:hypothetical protein